MVGGITELQSLVFFGKVRKRGRSSMSAVLVTIADASLPMCNTQEEPYDTEIFDSVEEEDEDE